MMIFNQGDSKQGEIDVHMINEEYSTSYKCSKKTLNISNIRYFIAKLCV